MSITNPQNPVSGTVAGGQVPSQGPAPPVAKVFTAADLAVLPSDLPSGPVVYELDNGRLITMPPPGNVHGAIETKFAGAFLYEGEKRGHGKARCGEVGIILWKNPDRVVG